MAAPRKVIISCAITGSIHTPSMSPHLPVSGDDIVASALGAAEAGAAILHLHVRNPETGQPSQSIDLFRPVLERLKQATNAVLNITTGGSPHMSVNERLLPARTFSPEIASLNMGSMNFGLFPMLRRQTELRQPWEREHLEKSRDLIFRNTFADIEQILAFGGENSTRFEYECYDIGHLYSLAHFLDRKLVKPPLFVQSVFGILGGIGSHPEDVLHMKRTADRLFGDQYHWSVLGAGRSQMAIAAQSAAIGGNVRVGLEDSLWAGPGRLSTSNAEQVLTAKQIIAGLALESATPDEARTTLGLKGASGTKF
jgi:uncharacterized protein (DUF849 family)